MRSNKNAGFTLVELLVVISIVALLLAVMLPGLSNAREVAVRAKCMAGARQLDLANKTYASDFGNYGPANYNNSSFPIRSTLHPTYDKIYQVLITDLNYVPRSIFTNKDGCGYGPRAFTSNALGSNPQQGDNFVTYGYNSKLQGGWGFGTNPDNGNVNSNGYYGPMRLDRFRAGRHPHLLGTVLDSANSGTHGNGGRDHLLSMRIHLGLASSYYYPRDFRHRAEGLTMIFHDGHGKFVSRNTFNDYVVGSASAETFMHVTFRILFDNYQSNFIDGGGRQVFP